MYVLIDHFCFLVHFVKDTFITYSSVITSGNFKRIPNNLVAISAHAYNNFSIYKHIINFAMHRNNHITLFTYGVLNLVLVSFVFNAYGNRKSAHHFLVYNLKLL